VVLFTLAVSAKAEQLSNPPVAIEKRGWELTE
jgi:hypothetical protein